MENENEEFRETLNDKDFNSTSNTKKNKKVIYGIIILSIILVLTIILIIILARKSSEGDYVGEISCIYDIKNKGDNIKILGNEFVKSSNYFDIFIDDNKIKYSKEHTFDEKGEHKVIFKLYIFYMKT